MQNTMSRWRNAILGSFVAAIGFSGVAHGANCDADRKLYPKNWNALAAETPLFTCVGHYVRLRIFLTPRSESTLMLTVANDKSIYRAIVDVRDGDRIRQQAGLYILNSEKTCFIRGNYSSPAVLSFADNSRFNAISFLFAADSLDAFEGCTPVK